MVSKQMALEKLNRQYTAETRSFLEKRYSSFPLEFVYGEGLPDCRLMLVGEAPGREEVRQGRPFVGKAGGILADFLEKVGLNRSDLYITNTIKYRLAREGARPGTLTNRPATAAEIRRSVPFLRQEIEIVKPECVVSLGNVPLSCIQQAFGAEDVPDRTIGLCHGQVLPLIMNQGKTIFVPFYHPASILYNPSLKEVYEQDFDILRSLF